MKNRTFALVITILILTLIGCSNPFIQFENDQLEVINRDIVSISDSKNTLVLNNKKGDGMAIIKDLEFKKGVIELEIKGENNPGKSFVGIAFNIQNDSTYEAVYFRPFNFQSTEKIRRKHAVQYIHHPTYTWRFLRTNHEGQYEAAYPRQPLPDEWFGIEVRIDDKKVYVYDQETNTELLSVERLTKQVSNRIGLWTGFDSKGAFRNLKVKE
ncbi:hypothetical protein GCM10011344_34780 [Dokdonia pacifica]|uniref:3-keto-disaccharide hydrolase domain-containing protein n=1 Tax=Dokdonia pacifica TaxID=1627892 RepID=A0A239AN84_9FLAO|nr:hypothetical protein [Dokdonia pacifica]GGG30888.1 hypothetical protein GCM10011344_34780 [Dokdonia pacifica]SNR96990.1 hypothetical protein SAMN06265376_10524 [Dokdonia pacifica]